MYTWMGLRKKSRVVRRLLNFISAFPCIQVRNGVKMKSRNSPFSPQSPLSHFLISTCAFTLTPQTHSTDFFLFATNFFSSYSVLCLFHSISLPRATTSRRRKVRVTVVEYHSELDPKRVEREREHRTYYYSIASLHIKLNSQKKIVGRKGRALEIILDLEVYTEKEIIESGISETLPIVSPTLLILLSNIKRRRRSPYLFLWWNIYYHFTSVSWENQPSFFFFHILLTVPSRVRSTGEKS